VISREGELITTLGEGAFFGEMALVTNDKRSATANATSFCDVFELHRESFDRVTKSYPEFLAHVEDVMKKRSAA
jgi:CRP-like cAMP-binding protein